MELIYLENGEPRLGYFKDFQQWKDKMLTSKYAQPFVGVISSITADCSSVVVKSYFVIDGEHNELIFFDYDISITDINGGTPKIGKSFEELGIKMPLKSQEEMLRESKEEAIYSYKKGMIGRAVRKLRLTYDLVQVANKYNLRVASITSDDFPGDAVAFLDEKGFNALDLKRH